MKSTSFSEPARQALYLQNLQNLDKALGAGSTSMRGTKVALKSIRALLDANADVDVIYPKDNTTALFRAIYINRPDIALMLLQRAKKLNVEAKNDGGTPLLWAVGTESGELVHALVERGADINARNRYSSTCLHSARHGGPAEAQRGCRTPARGDGKTLISDPA